MPRPKDKLERVLTADGSLTCQEYLLECIVCGEAKPVSEFYPDNHSRNGYRSKCKSCQMVDNTTPEALAKKRDYNQRTRAEDVRIALYEHSKHRAKVQGVPYGITKEDIIVPKRCPVLDLPLEKGKGRIQDNSPTMDKVIPALGYVIGNCIVMSRRANTLKRDATIDEIYQIDAYMQRVKKLMESRGSK